MPGTSHANDAEANNVSNGTKQSTPLKKFSWSEINKHRQYNDCWIVVRGKVYDVTSWVPKHPGGRLILNGGGRESTAIFMSYHPLRVEKLLPKYLIGEVEDYNPYYQWDSDFYTTLKTRVEKYLADNNMNGNSFLLYFKALLVLALWFVFYYFSMVRGYTWVAILLGFVHSHFGITIGHDGNHGSFSSSQLLTRAAAHALDIMGGSSIVWIHQHNIGHHPNSNRNGTSYRQPWRWYHKYQHIYIWILFSAVTTKWAINDLKSFTRRKYNMIDFFELTKGDQVALYSTKLFFLVYMLIIPSFFNPLSNVLLMFALFMMTTSYWFVLMFSVNHLTEDSIFPNEKLHNRDWARLQVLTATNFAVGSQLWTWLSGGLNYQIEHHLFPGLPHTYLPAISPIVQQTCAEYGIKYSTFDSYFSAIYSHYKYLKELGEKPDKRD